MNAAAGTLGRWTGIDWRACPADVRARIDPAFIWADLDGFAQLGGLPARAPVLVELQDAALKDLARGGLPGLARLLAVAPAYTRDARADLLEARYATATAGPAFFRALAAADPDVAAVARVELGLAIRTPSSRPLPAIDPAHLPSNAAPVPGRTARRAIRPKVVIGIVDDGIPFANARLRDADGAPLVWHLWDQNPAASPGPGLPYGAELDRARIAAACGGIPAVAGLADEAAAYRRIGYRRNLRRGTHGAAVTGLAVGWPKEAIAKMAPALVCVQLPETTIADSSGASLGFHLLDALRYVVARADAIDPAVPVVVNLSFGRSAGPHDGSSLIEKAMDELIRLRGGRLEIVVAAGNNAQTRGHAAFGLDAHRRACELRWRLLPDDITPSFMEIWADAADAGALRGLAVDVVAPDGARLSAAASPDRRMIARNAVCTIVARRADGDRRVGFLIAVAPTAAGAAPRASSGIWRVRVAGSRAVRVNAWIQRDDTPYGQIVRGRQSYFDDPGYEASRVDDAGRVNEVDDPAGAALVRRSGTLNALATGRHTVVAGAYRRRDAREAAYSADGQPEAAGRMRRPNAMGPAEESAALGYALSTGTYSGSIIGVRGTSAAAPQVTRWIAARLAGVPAPDDELATWIEDRLADGDSLETIREALFRQKRTPLAVAGVTRKPRVPRHP
ncbi:MAG: S8 family serine peptidase [Burkholderiales bacterium]|nr:S8 family serine peptidase [Burkholderiales bacterium]